VKLRLHGTLAEVAEATRRLAEAFDVVAVSRPYPDRGHRALVRVYLELRLTPADQAPPATASDRRAR
jgi:hypothetical protein